MSCEVRWIKVAVGMHEDEKMRLIDNMEERDGVHYLWVCLLFQAAKTNSKGKIFLSEDIPYTNEMLSIIFNRSIKLVELSLKTFVALKMINIDERNFITILNWEKHQNIEGMEKIRDQNRKRAQRYRAKSKSEETLEVADKNDFTNNEENYNNVTVTEQSKKENKNKNKIKKENKKENNPEGVKSIWGTTEANEKKLNDLLEESETTLSESKAQKEITSAADIMAYIKKISGRVVKISLSAVKAAVAVHGGSNVKLVIDKAVEVNRLRMNYINGILKNWQAEGYPSDYDNCRNRNTISKSNECRKLSFNNFEPRVYDYDALEKALLGW